MTTIDVDATREVWDKWLQVWAGRDDLLPECLAPVYHPWGTAWPDGADPLAA